MGHLGQHLLDVAKPEIEADAAIGKEQAMAAGDRQRPLVDEGWLKGASSGQAARALRRSAWVRGYFSTLMKCSRDPLPDRGPVPERRPLWPES
jgi:hypothetical protein